MARIRRHIQTDRYAGLAVAEIFVESDKSTRLAPELRKPLDKTDVGKDYFLYKVVQGDHLDALAIRFLTDSRLWWILAEINRDVLQGPLDTLILPIGTILMIPKGGVFVTTV